MSTHSSLMLEYILHSALAEAESYIQSLDEKESQGGMSQHEIDASLMHHLSAYLTDQIKKLTVEDALSLYSLLHDDITLEIPEHLHSADRLVMLQLYLINRTEHELAVQFA